MYCFLDCLLYKYEKRALYVRFIWLFPFPSMFSPINGDNLTLRKYVLSHKGTIVSHSSANNKVFFAKNSNKFAFFIKTLVYSKYL